VGHDCELLLKTPSPRGLAVHGAISFHRAAKILPVHTSPMPAYHALAIPVDSTQQGDTMPKTHAEPDDHKAVKALQTPTDLDASAVGEISKSLRHLLADVFALYVKTKNFHWHMSGPHFRDYHLLLDEQAEQIFEMTDDIAERARKIGGLSLHSIGDIARHQRLEDNDDAFAAPHAMLKELAEDNQRLTAYLRQTHELCDKHDDIATASLLENWTDQTERRTWFLSETVREH
jgi:starvation-inducible DNA-binding protein